jgi:hypothetical protein
VGQQEQTGLPLINGLQASYKRAGSELLRVIKTVVVVGPPKRIVLAEDLGIREQHLSARWSRANPFPTSRSWTRYEQSYASPARTSRRWKSAPTGGHHDAGRDGPEPGS